MSLVHSTCPEQATRRHEWSRYARHRPECHTHRMPYTPITDLKCMCTLRAPSVHPPCTLRAPSVHPPCTLRAPFTHPSRILHTLFSTYTHHTPREIYTPGMHPRKFPRPRIIRTPYSYLVYSTGKVMPPTLSTHVYACYIHTPFHTVLFHIAPVIHARCAV